MLKFDREENGFFYHHFGCFYRYAVGNIPNARDCFEQSINQKINLAACLELAEIEAEAGNPDRAKTLLQEGLVLTPITRPEKEEREKLSDRIQILQSQLNISQ
ncbi:MAG: hypothetical protein AB4290_05025 [Spirulina sp.]